MLTLGSLSRADDLTKEGMLKGIADSAAFILFLSTGVLNRPYCQMEIRQALALEKPMVLLHEVRVLDTHPVMTRLNVCPSTGPFNDCPSTFLSDSERRSVRSL